VKKRIFISTGEVSGDLQGSLLIEALQQQAAVRGVELEVLALGGDRMAAAGAKLLGHTSAIGSMGIFESLPYVWPTLRVQRRAKAYLQQHPPDGVVLIDYMGPNIAFCNYLPQHLPGVPVIFYIAPQEWVWAVSSYNSVGIAQYAIDFHPCMQDTPPEAAGNIERPGVRQAHGQAYPGQIPLRALIPQKIDNLLVAGKSIATSYSTAAAYRVHSFEWSVGAAAGITADFALSRGLLPYQLVENLPRPQPELEALQKRIQQRGNPIAFPGTSIFNDQWQDWRVW